MPSLFDTVTETVQIVEEVPTCWWEVAEADDDSDGVELLTDRQYRAMQTKSEPVALRVAALPDDVLFQRCGGGRRVFRKRV